MSDNVDFHSPDSPGSITELPTTDGTPYGRRIIANLNFAVMRSPRCIAAARHF
jgi:hypothetical protein